MVGLFVHWAGYDNAVVGFVLLSGIVKVCIYWLFYVNLVIKFTICMFSKKKQSHDSDSNDKENGGKEKMKLSLYDRHRLDSHNDTKTKSEKIGQFLEAYKNVLSSKVYVASVIGRVMDVLAFKGYLVFLPKFLEHHFGIAQWKVHTLMGRFSKLSNLYLRCLAAIGVFGFGCGAIMSGFLMRRFKLNGRQAALFLILVSAINISAFVAKSFLSCHSTVNSIGLAGVETNFNYTNSCNQECGCQNARLFPVCDKTGSFW